MAGFPQAPLAPPTSAPGTAPSGPMPPLAAAPIGGGLSGMSLQTLLAFLAGAGLDKVVQALSKLRSPPGQGGAREHRGGVRMDAAKAPGLTIAPLLAQLAAMRSANAPPVAPLNPVTRP